MFFRTASKRAVEEPAVCFFTGILRKLEGREEGGRERESERKQGRGGRERRGVEEGRGGEEREERREEMRRES